MFQLILIHPKIIHFIIALFPVVLLLDILGLITKNEKFHFAAWINLLFAGASAAAAVISGLIAEERVTHSEEVHEIMETHETIGIIVLIAVILLIIWRILLKGRFPKKGAWGYFTISILTVGAMFYGAHLGGNMIFKYGVAVEAISEGGHEHSGGMESEDEHIPMDSILLFLSDKRYYAYIKLFLWFAD